ncbi:MAG: HesA/MoeB/ThiF family protein [Chlorobium sp.]
MSLIELQKQRYARHLSLSEIGRKGQEKLGKGRVLVVGAGGLGSPAALYLAAAGIGTLGIVDPDLVDISNLQRQILHTTGSIGKPKVLSAEETLRKLNPECKIECIPLRLSRQNSAEIIAGYDFIIDATDNFEAKFLIPEYCHNAGKPYSHAGILKFFGQTITVHPGRTACYRCLFHERTETGSQEPRGPLGAVPGVIGSIQATEAIKHLLSTGQPLTDTLLTFDALSMNFRKIRVRRDPQCPLCGDRSPSTSSE